MEAFLQHKNIDLFLHEQTHKKINFVSAGDWSPPGDMK